MALLAWGATNVQATDVGVSVVISQPGVYGRVDIGRFPNPEVITSQPVIIQPVPRPTGPVVVAPPTPPQPVYMWVPPGHRKHWHKHCHQYNACGQPVYFVQDAWYQQHVSAPTRGTSDERTARDGTDDHRGEGRGSGRGHGHGHGRGRGDD